MIDCINIDRKDVYDEIKALEPIILATHHDADGIYSAVLFSKIFKVDTVIIPEEFGDYQDADVSLDLGAPLNPDWRGIAIDHHPHDKENLQYKLVHGDIPTAGVMYEVFGEMIPTEWTWLVAGSLVGDGQAASIPPKIFEDHPELLESRGSIYKSYGKTNIYDYTLYSLLSSPINATCRIGSPNTAFKVLNTCRTPDDVVSHPLFRDDQDKVTREVDNVINQFGKDKKLRKSTYTIGNFFVMIFNSDYRIASRLASSISSSVRTKTIISINETTGGISVRGDLAYWLVQKMNPLGWKMGGHAGYCGGSLEGKTGENFLRDLRSVC